MPGLSGVSGKPSEMPWFVAVVVRYTIGGCGRGRRRGVFLRADAGRIDIPSGWFCAVIAGVAIITAVDRALPVGRCVEPGRKRPVTPV